MEAEQQTPSDVENKEISGVCFLAPDVPVTFLTKKLAGGRLVNQIQAVRQKDLDKTGILGWKSYQPMELKNVGIKETRKIGPGKSFVIVRAFVAFDKNAKTVIPI